MKHMEFGNQGLNPSVWHIEAQYGPLGPLRVNMLEELHQELSIALNHMDASAIEFINFWHYVIHHSHAPFFLKQIGSFSTNELWFLLLW